jgi:hypothetical protein
MVAAGLVDVLIAGAPQPPKWGFVATGVELEGCLRCGGGWGGAGSGVDHASVEPQTSMLEEKTEVEVVVGTAGLGG